MNNTLGVYVLPRSLHSGEGLSDRSRKPSRWFWFPLMTAVGTRAPSISEFVMAELPQELKSAYAVPELLCQVRYAPVPHSPSCPKVLCAGTTTGWP